MRSVHCAALLRRALQDTVFIALAVEALGAGGELIFVTPSFWMHTTHSAPLRDWLLARGAITDVVDFGEAAVFPGVSSAIVAFRFTKAAAGAPSPCVPIRYYEYVEARQLPTTGLALGDPTLFRTMSIPAFVTGGHWTLATAEEMAPALALEAACTPAAGRGGPGRSVARLGQYVDIANGMVSGLDAVFRIGPAL